MSDLSCLKPPSGFSSLKLIKESLRSVLPRTPTRIRLFSPSYTAAEPASIAEAVAQQLAPRDVPRFPDYVKAKSYTSP